MNESEIKYIENLPVERWEEYKNLKLEAIRTEPSAFSDELADALNFPDEHWKTPLDTSTPGICPVFAEYNGKLIGIGSVYLFKKQNYKHNASLESLYVSKDFRGMGIGKALIEKRIELISKIPGIKNIFCEIFSSQIASLELHKKLGFEDMGGIKNFLYINGKYFDSVMMQKKIN